MIIFYEELTIRYYDIENIEEERIIRGGII
jgi:hypothetical protein